MNAHALVIAKVVEDRPELTYETHSFVDKAAKFRSYATNLPGPLGEHIINGTLTDDMIAYPASNIRDVAIKLNIMAKLISQSIPEDHTRFHLAQAAATAASSSPNLKNDSLEGDSGEGEPESNLFFRVYSWN
jgi:hypothetical protein